MSTQPWETSGFFHGFEIVNCHNDNVCDGISDFTLSRYIEKKMVSGSVRLHLLMAEEASLPDDQNGDEHKDDPDYLPDLPCLRNGSHNGTSYVAASPSGEVLIKENFLMPPSTMSTPSAGEPFPGPSTEHVERPPSTRSASQPYPRPSTISDAYRRHL